MPFFVTQTLHENGEKTILAPPILDVLETRRSSFLFNNCNHASKTVWIVENAKMIKLVLHVGIQSILFKCKSHWHMTNHLI